MEGRKLMNSVPVALYDCPGDDPTIWQCNLIPISQHLEQDGIGMQSVIQLVGKHQEISFRA